MKNLIILFAITLSITSCGSGNQNEGESNSSKELSISNANNIESYLAIKDALVATNASEASKAAKAFMTKNEDDQLSSSLEQIANAQDVKEQRAAFETLSMKMYEIMKASEGEMILYKQYCPMAFNNKGAFWLAAEKEVNNPYFGDLMLHCGSVQETIN